MNFMKASQKIILFLYKAHVVSEDSILKWFKDRFSQKVKMQFLEANEKVRRLVGEEFKGLG